MDNAKKWTVVFLLRSVDDSLGQAVRLVTQLRKIDFGQEIQVVLCINTLKPAVKSIELGTPIPQPGNAPLVFTTVFYSLERLTAASPDGFLCQLVQLKQKDNFNIDDPADIKDFFKAQVLDRFPAERYALFTWDHGNGFAIFTAQDPAGEKDPEVSFTELQPRQSAQKATSLTMDSLANAIAWVFPNKKLDILVMMNCAMQSFDTGYALRNTVQFLVAPESSMDFAGYNYTFFFRKLAKDPGMDTRTWAKTIVDSFETTFYNPPAVGVAAKAVTALFAMDLRYYEKAGARIDAIARSLEKKMVRSMPEIQMAWSISLPLNKAVALVDFCFLMDNLGKTLGEDWEQKKRKSIARLRDKMIVARFIGSAYRQPGNTPDPTGFSVLFRLLIDGRSLGAEVIPIYNQFKADSFTRDLEWNKFVLRLVGLYP